MDFVPCNRKENCFSYFAIFILLGGIYILCVYKSSAVFSVSVQYRPHIAFIHLFIVCAIQTERKKVMGKKPFHFNYVLKERSHNHGSNFKVLSFCVYTKIMNFCCQLVTMQKNNTLQFDIIINFFAPFTHFHMRCS